MDTIGYSLAAAAAAGFLATATALVHWGSRRRHSEIPHGEKATLHVAHVAPAKSSAPPPTDIAGRQTVLATEIAEVRREEPPETSISHQVVAKVEELSVPPAASKPPAVGPAELTVVKGADTATWKLDRPKMFIGRAPDVECSIQSLTVSRKHALIEKKTDGYYLWDCGSKNGTYYNGNRLRDPLKLKNGDSIEIGEIVLRFTQG